VVVTVNTIVMMIAIVVLVIVIVMVMTTMAVMVMTTMALMAMTAIAMTMPTIAIIPFFLTLHDNSIPPRPLPRRYLPPLTQNNTPQQPTHRSKIDTHRSIHMRTYNSTL